jgi:hypothetical protein
LRHRIGCLKVEHGPDGAGPYRKSNLQRARQGHRPCPTEYRLSTDNMDGGGSRPYWADQVFGGGGICRDASARPWPRRSGALQKIQTHGASTAPAERGPTENPTLRRVHDPGGAGPYRITNPQGARSGCAAGSSRLPRGVFVTHESARFVKDNGPYQAITRVAMELKGFMISGKE